jgi:hypothetical protein
LHPRFEPIKKEFIMQGEPAETHSQLVKFFTDRESLFPIEMDPLPQVAAVAAQGGRPQPQTCKICTDQGKTRIFHSTSQHVDTYCSVCRKLGKPHTKHNTRNCPLKSSKQVAAVATEGGSPTLSQPSVPPNQPLAPPRQLNSQDFKRMARLMEMEENEKEAKRPKQ